MNFLQWVGKQWRLHKAKRDAVKACGPISPEWAIYYGLEAEEERKNALRLYEARVKAARASAAEAIFHFESDGEAWGQERERRNQAALELTKGWGTYRQVQDELIAAYNAGLIDETGAPRANATKP